MIWPRQLLNDKDIFGATTLKTEGKSFLLATRFGALIRVLIYASIKAEITQPTHQRRNVN